LDIVARAGQFQVIPPSSTPRTFGTASETVHVIGASEFDWRFQNVTFPPSLPYVEVNGQAFARQLLPDDSMLAWVRLPGGALITGVELEACDTNDARAVEFVLVRQGSPASPVEFIMAGSTGGAQTPGCGFFPFNMLGNPAVIDNEHNTYILIVASAISSPGVGLTAFIAVRIYYHLQISPAPAVATFGDVPVGHPQRQYIEALVASGITAGCGGGNYCPDAPLTRGQMAVFLSKALGLHFAP
jgi:hypothetical protein